MFSGDAASSVTFKVILKFLSPFCLGLGNLRSFKFASRFGLLFYTWTVWYYVDSFINHFTQGRQEPPTPATCPPRLDPSWGFASVRRILQLTLARAMRRQASLVLRRVSLCICVYSPPSFSMNLTSKHSCVCLDLRGMFTHFFHVLWVTSTLCIFFQDSDRGNVGAGRAWHLEECSSFETSQL